MRADRLIALVLLLQARGRLTAEDLAARLEVSARTIYRDLDALSAAGVPVYAECGRGGGISLPDDYRVDLTALNKEEARVLFLGGLGDLPAPLADLGVGPVLDGALRKLAAALPAASRDEAERARQRLLVDAEEWWSSLQSAGAPRVPAHLRTIEQAVWQERRLRLVYPRRVRTEGSVGAVDGPDTERIVDPYALVAKRGVWYLVAGPSLREVPPTGSGADPAPSDGPRVYRVSRVRDAEVLDQPSHRPPDFDLPRFWAAWCAEFVARIPSYTVTLRAAPALARRLARNPVKGAGFPAEVRDTDAAGWVTMALDLEAPEVAYTDLLAYGPAVEVLDPPDLRARIATAAAGMAALYA
jgi:predicted DNA-binding transcriptional regulator YafY